MKVLMFGWEFPPHISGGLGTACFGLTNSLSKEEVEILFVVPKLHGDEPANRTSLINASKVAIPTVEKRRSVTSSVQNSESDNRLQNFGSDLYTIRLEKNIQHIEVPSSLHPYRSPDFRESSQTIEHWNYQLVDTDEVYALHTSHDAENASRFTEHSSEEKSLKPYAFSGTYGPNLLEEVDRYAEVAAIIAKQHDFDVIHAHDWMTYMAGITAKKISGKPLVVHVHATEYDRSGEHVDPHVFSLEKKGMTEADCVVTVSNWTKNIVVNRYNVPEEKVEVVHNGIIPTEVKEPEIFKAPPVGSHVVTFLGRITHQKGPIYFVEAARKVLEKFPDAHFVVAGSGDMLPLMMERIAQLRMSKNFHFTGFLKGKDIDKVWSMSNVYVMPSVSEPFGIAPLEAIQAGVPVIISNQAGVAEVMPHAIKVDFWNSDALANAICSILKYKSLHNTLKKNGAEEIKSITWDNAAKKLKHIYHELTTQ